MYRCRMFLSQLPKKPPSETPGRPLRRRLHRAKCRKRAPAKHSMCPKRAVGGRVLAGETFCKWATRSHALSRASAAPNGPPSREGSGDASGVAKAAQPMAASEVEAAAIYKRQIFSR